MNDEEGAAGLTAMLRSFMASVRARTANPDGGEDPVDRILAAVTLLISAGLIAWPSSRKAPAFAVKAMYLARRIWARRSWWLPAEPPGTGTVTLIKE